jgi:NmrA-like family
MLSNNKKLVAVVGATGQQGGGVVRRLQASGQFKIRALSRNPLRYALSRGGRHSRDVQLLPSSYLLRFGFVRPNCARKQNSRQATDQVFDVGSTECPGPEPLNAYRPTVRINPPS